MFRGQYGDVFQGQRQWNAIAVASGDLYAWDATSTYVKNPPLLRGHDPRAEAAAARSRGRVLALLGDSVTTDHISPAGQHQQG